MAADSDDILDGLFHWCAWVAYLEQAAEQQGWPDSEATRQRAYDYYEAALAAKRQSASRSTAAGVPTGQEPAGAMPNRCLPRRDW